MKKILPVPKGSETFGIFNVAAHRKNRENRNISDPFDIPLSHL